MLGITVVMGTGQQRCCRCTGVVNAQSVCLLQMVHRQHLTWGARQQVALAQQQYMVSRPGLVKVVW